MKPTTILSTKLTSINIQQSNYAGFIDKFILDAKELRISKDEFTNHLKSIGTQNYEDGSFRGKGGMRIEVTLPTGNKVYLKYYYTSEIINQIIINPSSYSSFESMLEDISTILPIDRLLTLPIIRVDKTVDIAIGLHEIYRGLNIKNKRFTRMYDYNSGKLSNIEIGKEPERTKIYDKRLKAKYDFQCSRIEVYCTRNKVEFPNLSEMSRTWRTHKSYQDKSFKSISLNDIQYNDLKKPLQIEKQKTLNNFLIHMPYCLARSFLNKKGNFNRDYKNLFELKPWKVQPSIILNEGLRKFFNNSETGDKNGYE